MEAMFAFSTSLPSLPGDRTRNPELSSARQRAIDGATEACKAYGEKEFYVARSERASRKTSYYFHPDISHADKPLLHLPYREGRHYWHTCKDDNASETNLMTSLRSLLLPFFIVFYNDRAARSGTINSNRSKRMEK